MLWTRCAAGKMPPIPTILTDYLRNKAGPGEKTGFKGWVETLSLPLLHPGKVPERLFSVGRMYPGLEANPEKLPSRSYQFAGLILITYKFNSVNKSNEKGIMVTKRTWKKHIRT
jgi:hypothetical protein